MEAGVALLRGINVGGHRRVPMAALRQGLETAGFTEVRTYIQSGNVMFRSTPAGDTDPATAVADVIATGFGIEVPVVWRTRTELVSVLDAHPYRAEEDDLTKLHVVFLDAAPDPERLVRLDPNRSPPDRFVVEGRELYLHYPNGAGRTKLTADYLERTLQRTATARNLNTITRLVELMGR